MTKTTELINEEIAAAERRIAAIRRQSNGRTLSQYEDRELHGLSRYIDGLKVGRDVVEAQGDGVGELPY